ncbi:bifunctional adenosylcobinamide kinase/adenosylcobinamide-phosphate guanylyltransferase [Picosynechococcus sp. PCC 7117]|uniref:bifunctional adenosylcobinamide kinase/adenosylcobinamide-phosphate guanylyltransferase n=1 Tax=Picosynechococcus sp. PCC 7117 TaxID=195498 RepID=UPI0008103B1A|nr:bifunctional adenosylcobinamide kinase/adenosylcobinamide-phosphate guanylyltransferase [Picosynechococcus sp. PCC 7117]ANV87409.1 bifunctional adenosylcobinamide kinase/adenosylcobinamide-phosphate guanylyltransferase [Picosynechococcus sp. PCC 7117]
MGQTILVTGAVRSGKSEWAEHLALQSQRPITYIATATENPDDPEWMARIQHHRDRRPKNWGFMGESVHLTEAMRRIPEDHCVLVDSLGLWVANHLETEPAPWQQLTTAFLEAIKSSPRMLILVAEETGWGLVPTYPLGRLFRDRLGRLIREVGLVSDQVYLLVGGHALDIKTLGHPLPPVKMPLS